MHFLIRRLRFWPIQIQVSTKSPFWTSKNRFWTKNPIPIQLKIHSEPPKIDSEPKVQFQFENWSPKTRKFQFQFEIPKVRTRKPNSNTKNPVSKTSENRFRMSKTGSYPKTRFRIPEIGFRLAKTGSGMTQNRFRMPKTGSGHPKPVPDAKNRFRTPKNRFRRSKMAIFRSKTGLFWFKKMHQNPCSEHGFSWFPGSPKPSGKGLQRGENDDPPPVVFKNWLFLFKKTMYLACFF